MKLNQLDSKNSLSNEEYKKQFFRDFSNLKPRAGNGFFESIQIQESNDPKCIMAVNIQNISKPTFIINRDNCINKLKLSPKEMPIIISHEFNHLYEEAMMNSTIEGRQFSKRFYESYSKLSEPKQKAKHTLYNCLRDVYVNNRSLDYFPTWTTDMRDLYKNKLFGDKKMEDGTIIPGNDMRNLPRHLQLVYAMLCEHYVPDEKCLLSEDVRWLVDYYYGKMGDDYFNISNDQKAITKATSIDISLEDRLKYIQEYIEPEYRKLYEEDMEDYKDQKEQEEKQKNISDQTNEQLKDTLTKENQDEVQENKEGLEENKELDNNIFDPSLYEKGQIPHAIDDLPEDIQKEIKDAIENAIEYRNSPDFANREKYRDDAQKLVDEGLDDREVEEVLDDIVNYEEYQTKLKSRYPLVYRQLKDIFKKVYSRRENPQIGYTGPVPFDQGSRLSDNMQDVIKGIIDIKGWDPNPRMAQKYHKKINYDTKANSFDLIFIGDGSSSMDSAGSKKLSAQRDALCILMDAIHSYSPNFQSRKLGKDDILNIYTQLSVFNSEKVTICKKYGTKYNYAEKIKTYKKLSKSAGTTGDYKAIEQLEDLLASLDSRKQAAIFKGKHKMLVVVSTDGESNDSNRLKKVVKNLRQKGVVVIGLGITDSGQSVEENYKAQDSKQGKGIISPDIDSLPKDFADAISPILENL